MDQSRSGCSLSDMPVGVRDLIYEELSPYPRVEYQTTTTLGQWHDNIDYYESVDDIPRDGWIWANTAHSSLMMADHDLGPLPELPYADILSLAKTSRQHYQDAMRIIYAGCTFVWSPDMCYVRRRNAAWTVLQKVKAALRMATDSSAVPIPGLTVPISTARIKSLRLEVTFDWVTMLKYNEIYARLDSKVTSDTAQSSPFATDLESTLSLLRWGRSLSNFDVKISFETQDSGTRTAARAISRSLAQVWQKIQCPCLILIEPRWSANLLDERHSAMMFIQCEEIKRWRAIEGNATRKLTYNS